MSRRRKPFSGVRVLGPVLVQLDGTTYEAHYHGDREHTRIYERRASGMRLVKDDDLATRVFAEIQRKNMPTAFGVPGAKPVEVPPDIPTNITGSITDPADVASTELDPVTTAAE